MADVLIKIEKAITQCSRVIALVGLFGLLLLSVITVGEVALRTVFNYPILGVSDVSTLIITIVVASCFPLVSAERNHIAVTVVGTKLGPRINALLECFGAFVIMVFFIFLVHQLWLYSRELASAGETTWLLLWPRAPWWAAVTLLIAACIPNQLVCMILSFKEFLNSGKEQD